MGSRSCPSPTLYRKQALCFSFIDVPAIRAHLAIVNVYQIRGSRLLDDYHWWWRSYLTSGSSAIYLMLYSSFYFYTKLDISKPVPTMLYFGYMFIVSYSFFILTGTIGFVSTFFFVRAIYASVKID
eukprot:1177106-Prorocentrum_minimum.AAC.1